METMTDIPESKLNDVLGDIARAKMRVVSIERADDGTYSTTYTSAASEVSQAFKSLSASLPVSAPVANMDLPDLPPPGAARPFVHARSIAYKTVLYTDAEGRDEIREGGSRSWRNCNPGNIRKGDFSLNAGAIGDDGSFAIFPDEQTGTAAIIALLKTSKYINLTLRDAVFRYAPPSENNSAAYAAALAERTGIPLDTPLSTLKADEFRKFARRIQEIEGWKPGLIRANAPAALRSTTTSAIISSAASATQDWMDIARCEAALPAHERSQWPDPGENPRILNYFKVCSAWFEADGGDEVDWCAAFVNYCLVTSGHMGTDHPGARSFFWNKKGQFISLPKPIPGSIAVRRYAPFSDPKWESGPGHVGFVIAASETTVTLLGGNQSGTVRESVFPLVSKDASGAVTAKFIAFMMPAIM
ncbi:conjugal transfer protein [Rhizobium sp. BG4]|uniref:conjugal transfer protein n=1 Tax=Rhizobium sp. BG4 TaxID=2613770 RepID=UPI00193E778A|nr:conjugal transfer protein [Rhizobium sp. BG4]QRM45218.1 conjugal transfer protein [Rhizobium sp. BG4]